MAQQLIVSGTGGAGDSGSVAAGKINDNFTELYAGSGVSDGTYGDIVVSSSGTVFTIGAGAVTYAKMQDVSAASKLLGRGSASGSGDVQEITIGSGLTMTGTTLSSSGGGGTVDSAITNGSTNPVENNAIFDALALKADLAAPIITGAWDLRGGYGAGGLRAWDDAGSGLVGIGFHNYFGTLCGYIYVGNSGQFVISQVISIGVIYGTRFSATDANGGAVANPLFVLDETPNEEGGFYCPVSFGVKDVQVWSSNRTARVYLYKSGQLEFLPAASVVFNPAASATPPANGNLVIEATSNTSLTFKYKGSDGTVRSGSIALS